MTRIYYFSGTGNSLAIARGIARRLGETDVIPITRAAPAPVPEGCRVGIVSPVYYLDLPKIVVDFISGLSLPAGTDAFGVVNMGLLKGNSLVRLRSLLAGKGAESFAGYSVRMPDNSVAFPTKASEIPILLDASTAEIERIAADLSIGGKGDKVVWSAKDVALGAALGAYCEHLLGFTDIRHDESCVGCGVCARACPVGNIEMADGKPVWKDECASCFACIHRCPKRAVAYRNMKREGLRQYVHPLSASVLVKAT